MTPVLSFRVVGLPAPQLPRHIQAAIREDESGCWIWLRSRSRDGYGWASLHTKTHQAHRLVYRLLVGEPAAGQVLDHLCRVRHCVNPAHLQEVTPRENLARSELTPAGMRCCAKCGSSFIRIRGQRRCPGCLAAYNLARRPIKAAMERQRRERMAGAER